MSSIAKQHIFVVDDEAGVCEAIHDTLKQHGAKVTSFSRAAACLEQLSSQMCDLLITDLRMPYMDGIELVKNVKCLTPWLPIMIITGYGDIPTAVMAMKAGATDVIEKPLNRESLIDKVESMLRGNGNNNRLYRPLTPRERTVLRLVLEGNSSREIARKLNRSVRTIELHRSHIMHKLGVDNVVDLLKRAAVMGLIE